jgi:hypothetical protein
MRLEPSTYARELTEAVHQILGEELVAGWIAGSVASGDFVPGSSDLDVGYAVEGALTDRRKLAVAEAVLPVARTCPASRLEMVVYSMPCLRAAERWPRFELNLNTGGGVERVESEPAADQRHWFLLDLEMARDHARAITGPSPRALVAPRPRGMVLKAIAESLAWHESHEPTSPNTVLNACRSWCWLSRGVWTSKSEAASCAKGNEKHASLIEAAAASRRSGRAAQLPPAEVDDLVEDVREMLRGA